MTVTRGAFDARRHQGRAREHAHQGRRLVSYSNFGCSFCDTIMGNGLTTTEEAPCEARVDVENARDGEDEIWEAHCVKRSFKPSYDDVCIDKEIVSKPVSECRLDIHVDSAVGLRGNDVTCHAVLLVSRSVIVRPEAPQL